MKVLLVLNTIVFTLTFAFTTTLAQEPNTVLAEVVYDNLNLRIEPSRDATVILQLEQGTLLTVTGYLSEYREIWIQVIVSSSGVSGWVHKDYIQFFSATWRREVEELTPLILYPEMQTPPIRANASIDGVPVRDTPSYVGDEVVSLYEGQEVLVYFERMDDDAYRTYYVYIESPDGDFIGWVNRYQLEFPTWYHNKNLPMQDATAPVQPITSQGQGIGYISEGITVRLREAPSVNSSVIQTLDSGTFITMYGRTSNRIVGWLYVRVVDTGEIGWIYDPQNYTPKWVNYPIGQDFQSIPIIASNPPQVLEIPALTALSATTTQVAPLREFTNVFVDIFTYVPANIDLTLTGRNINGEWYQTTYDGWIGWIWYGNLDFAEPPYLLPIISLHEGRDISN